MKFLAVLQIVCILLLSAFAGAAQTETRSVKLACCQKFDANNPCQQKKSNKKNDCGNQGCNMILSCAIYGFLATEPLVIEPVVFTSIAKPIFIYKIGHSSGYFPSNWKPPKIYNI